MSMKESIRVKCTSCGEESDFLIWPSINTGTNPEMKEKCKSGEVFRFVCPYCGRDQIVPYACLYHQSEEEIMIYLVSRDAAEKAEKTFREGWSEVEKSSPDRYIRRIVTSVRDFMEKIRIFDQKLDDRVIEFMKLFVMQKFYEDHPEMGDLETVLYDDSDDDSLKGDGIGRFLLVQGGRPVGLFPLTFELYHSVEEPVLSAGDLRGGKDFVVDFAWARRLLDTLT